MIISVGTWLWLTGAKRKQLGMIIVARRILLFRRRNPCRISLRLFFLGPSLKTSWMKKTSIGVASSMIPKWFGTLLQVCKKIKPLKLLKLILLTGILGVVNFVVAADREINKVFCGFFDQSKCNQYEILILDHGLQGARSKVDDQDIKFTHGVKRSRWR
ncbi:uncharacterized protein LOC126686349 [Mercurialis annua]|uniref:uncharacterized protein LOC126686349 n=1 Tax=Mercurialis annua TaxID=3986 RepID=UPI00215EF1EC|nr:uncharacterized protein LOC126686349 [Mercurialis annua]